MCQIEEGLDGVRYAAGRMSDVVLDGGISDGSLRKRGYVTTSPRNRYCT